MTRKKLNFQSFATKVTRAGVATTAVALTVLLTTASSWAQSATPPMDAMPANNVSNPMTAVELMSAFTKSDTNKDSKLSKEEAAGVPGLVAKFEAIDTDGDKFISKAEFEKAVQ